MRKLIETNISLQEFYDKIKIINNNIYYDKRDKIIMFVESNNGIWNKYLTKYKIKSFLQKDMVYKLDRDMILPIIINKLRYKKIEKLRKGII